MNIRNIAIFKEISKESENLLLGSSKFVQYKIGQPISFNKEILSYLKDI